MSQPPEGTDWRSRHCHTHTKQEHSRNRPTPTNLEIQIRDELSKTVKSQPRAPAARTPGLSVSAPRRPRVARRRARDGPHGEHGHGQGAAGGCLRLHTRGRGVRAVGRCSQSRPPPPGEHSARSRRRRGPLAAWPSRRASRAGDVTKAGLAAGPPASPPCTAPGTPTRRRLGTGATFVPLANVCEPAHTPTTGRGKWCVWNALCVTPGQENVTAREVYFKIQTYIS